MRFYCLFLFLPFLLRSQTSNISGTINVYGAVTSVAAQSVNLASATGFLAGDKVLIIQMKGATINVTNTPSFGTILNYNNAGNYEFASIASIAGTTVNFVSPLIRTYTAADFVQLVKVPTYVNVNVTGLLSGNAWNGSTGGVLVLEASATVTLNANVDMSGKGFRGGVLQNGAFSACGGDTSDYVLPSTTIASGQKGEGIVNPNSSISNGKGAWANGGGGGNDCNGGGAGGGNYGLGGHGGDPKVNVSCPPYYYQRSGGCWGQALNYSNAANKIFLGGGGGAPHQNDGAGTAGQIGGGIVIIRAASIVGNNNSIIANGNDVTAVASIDGQGGGGAGGTVLLDACSMSSLNVYVKGGQGGHDNFGGTDCHGKGGGGAGGIVWGSTSLAGVTTNLSGGLPGVFTSGGSLCYNTSNGATQGGQGGTLTGLMIPGTVPLGSVPGQVIDTTVCTNSSVLLNAPAATSYTWSTGSTNQSINVSTAGNYWVQSYPAGSCQIVTDTFHLLITAPPIVNVIHDTALCDNTVTLNAASGALTYSWSTGSTSASIGVGSSGIYWVDMNINSCIVRDSALVMLYPMPVLATTDYTVCSGQSIVVTPTVTGGTAPYTYQWGNGNTTGSNTITPAAGSTAYSVYVTDAHGCSSPVNTGTITQLPPLVVNLNGTSVCSGDSIKLLPTVSGGDGAYTYTWAPGNSHLSTLSVSSPAVNTVYTVVVSDGCHNTAADTALVIVTPAPVIPLPNAISGCAPVCLNMNSIPFATLVSWQWNFGDGTNSGVQDSVHCYSKSGSYNLSFSYTTNLGCVKTVSSSGVVTVFPQPTAAFTASSLETDMINAEIEYFNQSTGYGSSQWTFGNSTGSSLQNPTHTFPSPGTYAVTLVVSNQLGCIDSVTQYIVVHDVFTFYTPDCFTPNFDGGNDIFIPLGTGWLDGSYRLVVYDRWGNLVLSTTDPQQGWNGTFKGVDAPEDVYVWKAEVKDLFKKQHKYTGAIKLVR